MSFEFRNATSSRISTLHQGYSFPGLLISAPELVLAMSDIDPCLFLIILCCGACLLYFKTSCSLSAMSTVVVIFLLEGMRNSFRMTLTSIVSGGVVPHCPPQPSAKPPPRTESPSPIHIQCYTIDWKIGIFLIFHSWLDIHCIGDRTSKESAPGLGTCVRSHS
ncbi:hypothetical protein DFS33DRAFT_1368618 [Desarmillaria ectypa]|nr:hypothetical protein DFS33DRAFT_1368618 [Desarmillaria ectypa]